MNKLLKGNYQLNNPVGYADKNTPKDIAGQKTKEYQANALNSIGGSMVFVERRKVIWRPET